eukprot:TRINITY_DN4389_c1_g1_i1.p1 TRINITY_DN4389_c1_g1~~TRINITY_DN4389_c1_g1_i1.p1  ORF type:complete len:206 (+),score=67.93 TRINITY_DN4389_c1_g1_i1:368-985(+)
MADLEPERRYKVLLVGGIDVGKTSILLRYTKNEFSDKSIYDLDVVHKDIEVDGMHTRLIFPDTAGQERFNTLTTSFFRNADAVLATYSICDESSFDEAEGNLRNNQILSRAKRFLVANKKDLNEDEDASKEVVVDTARGKELAESDGIDFYEVSAKTGEGIEAMFVEIAKSLVAEDQLSASSTGTLSLTSSPRGHKSKSGFCSLL